MTSTRKSEHQEQVLVIRWFDQNHWQYRGRLFAVPNGAYLGGETLQDRKRLATKLKREGLRRGAPDLILPVARNGYHAMAIELKRKDKTAAISKEQRNWNNWLNNNGWYAVICRGHEAAIEEIQKYLGEKDNHE